MTLTSDHDLSMWASWRHTLFVWGPYIWYQPEYCQNVDLTFIVGDRGWPRPLTLTILCARGHMSNKFWNMVRNVNWTFDLVWAWLWLILCTRRPYEQYMFKYGKIKMPILPLTFGDFEWPWLWIILCTRGTYEQYIWKKWSTLSIWPLTLGDIGWPWSLFLTFGDAVHSENLMFFVYSPYD